MAKPLNDKRKRNRKPGHPKRGEPCVTPRVLMEIGRLYLQGRGVSEIARQFDVDESTVRYHLDAKLKPMWKERVRGRLAEDLARVDLLERTAWERFYSEEAGETHETIEKALLEGGNKPRIVKQVMRTVAKTGSTAWLEIVKWCIEFRARIHGHEAPKQVRVDHGGELRVAGKTPSEVDSEMMQALMTRIAERRAARAAIDNPEQN